MAIEIYGQVGLQSLSKGAKAIPRLGMEAESIVSQWLPDYGELARQGYIFTGMTAVTGVAPGTAIGTTPAFAIKNPLNSGKIIIPLVVAMGYVSGTLGAGVVAYCANLPADNTTLVVGSGAAITPYNSKGNRTVANLFTSGTLGAAPAPFRPFASLQASLASTAIAPWLAKDELKGEISLEPGAALSLQATAAGGSTPLVVYGMSWIEVPIVQ